MKRLFQRIFGKNTCQTEACERCQSLVARITKLEETNLIILKRLIQLGEPVFLNAKAKASANQAKPAKLVILKKPTQEQKSDRLSLLDPHKEPTYH